MYKNILVNFLGNLGDVVLTTSALDLIKKSFPETKITMLVKPAMKDAVQDNPVVDDVIIFNYSTKEISFSATRKMISEIRRRKFDLSISFDRKLRPALLSFMSGIKRRVGPSKVLDEKKSRVTILYTDVIEIPYDLDKVSQAETYQEIVRKFFGIEGHGEPHFPQKKSAVAEKLLSRLPEGKIKIALCVKGTFALKTYPKEYFAEIIQALRKKYDATFFVIGVQGDRDYANEVIAESGGGIFNFCGETSLTDLAEIFRRTDLFLSVDTGSAHIAATTGIKMVVMFGCTSPSRWSPINKNSISLSAGENCCPCKIKVEKCPSYPKPNCLYNLKPEEVIRAAENFLGQRKLSCN